jgi:hypothetical protein
MGKIVVFSVDGTRVEGEFSAQETDYVLVLGKGSPVHAWRDGVDSCNVLGAPCPLQPMAGYGIPANPYAAGTYSIGATRPAEGDSPGVTNGTLNVGSGPGDGDGDGGPQGRRRRT